MKTILLATATLMIGVTSARAGVITYGDKDVLNGTGVYPLDPVTGATLQGLAANVITVGAPAVSHGFPFSPSVGDYPGTDRIYVGSGQTGFHDGYSGQSVRVKGPQVITLNYALLIPAGEVLTTLTLGIAADDFQNTVFGQPFTASINGVVNSALTTKLNSLNQTGPVVQFFTIGIAPGTLLTSNILTLTIDQGGDGGDGWAIDFLTVGVTSQPVPEPTTIAVFGVVSLVAGCRRFRNRRTVVQS